MIQDKRFVDGLIVFYSEYWSAESIEGESEIDLSNVSVKIHFKAKLDPKDRNMFALKRPADDNYMLKSKWLGEILLKVRWKPVLDICCNVLGTNALAPLYFDANSNSFD